MRRHDVAVIGAGPAGIAAACRAAEAGARVLVMDDNPAPGGQIWRNAAEERWLRRLAESGAEVQAGAVISDALPPAKNYVLATGARELFLPFPGWTLPGVFGAGGMQALVKSGLDVADKRVVVGGSGPLLLAVAALLREHGASVALVAEQAPAWTQAAFAARMWRWPSKLGQGVRLKSTLLGVPWMNACHVEAAEGRQRVERVRLRRGSRTWEQDCDCLAVGYGLVPNIELALWLGCRVKDGFVAVDGWQETNVDGIFAAGEVTGIGGVEKAVVEGEIAGLGAAGHRGLARPLLRSRERAKAFAGLLSKAFALDDALRLMPRPDTTVCRCEDVSHARLSGMGSWREAKLQTRCGMGSCQGRVCGAATKFLYGWGAESVRPPVFPANVGSLMETRQL